MKDKKQYKILVVDDEKDIQEFIEYNLKKEGYNVNQAKIAIGSGGFFGKGYLQGTQTKYDFVPEQDTAYTVDCLRDLADFVGKMNAERKTKKHFPPLQSQRPAA